MKRIILFLDHAAGASTPAASTNVGKLHKLVAPFDSQGIPQVPHFVGGVASVAENQTNDANATVVLTAKDRIAEAYRILVASYEPGDEIHIFGFSDGALGARHLAAFIALLGVGPAHAGFAFDEGWTLYCRKAAKRDPARLAKLRAAAHYPARIRCVGLWDARARLGSRLFPRLFGLPDLDDTMPAEAMDVGLQALAVDEVRGRYAPALWTLPSDRRLPAHQHVEQVWFAGSHADIGGGHRETGLSDIALLWMAERAEATTGLAFDTEALAGTTRPDPLGPQHRALSLLSFFVPFIRLVWQTVEAVPGWRRAVIGFWRTGKLPRGENSVHESIHDSVFERFGRKVIELRVGRSHIIAYRPHNLAPVMPAVAEAAAAQPEKTARRVKIFTVHGTFAHEADWDDWDKDDGTKKIEDCRFVNRLRRRLREHDVILDEEDHTQFNWSGGNSHDERRTAAIGLKKAIQDELSDKYAAHGDGYYDGGVYVIGHSHGGTISRLAMNLWDKDYDYYDPVKDTTIDEFKHDDECATCLRVRNGKVGPNTVRRPDGVITFGSPFVSFEKRRGGLLTARIGAWVFRILLAIPVAAILCAAYVFSGEGVVDFFWKFTPGFLQTIVRLAWPLALLWLVSTYLPRQIEPIERWLGKGTFLLALHALLQGLKYLVLAGAGIYYLAYLTGERDRLFEWLPLANESFQFWFSWAVLLATSWFWLIAVPGAFLSWLNRKVVGLQDKLPKKYDPAEDRPVSYISYHTLGDEAGIHLKIFGLLTWLVETLALSAACVLAFGIVVMVFIAIESVLNLSSSASILDTFGISPVSDHPEVRDRFIAVMDGLTYFPKLVWSHLINSQWLFALGSLENPRAAAWYVPAALITAILLIFLLLMPFLLIGIGIVYLVTIWLRGTGVVFGSENFAWTLANRIAVVQHPNDNTVYKRFFISPEAWWRRDYAHCYYYKSGRVIDDVANHIADWGREEPTRAWPIGAWLGTAASGLVVLFFVLSIFLVSVPVAAGFASLGESFNGFAELDGLPVRVGGSAEGAPALAEVPRSIECKDAPYEVQAGFELLPGSSQEVLDFHFRPEVQSALRDRWRFDVFGKFGPEWAASADNDLELLKASNRPIEENCTDEKPNGGRLRVQCTFAAAPCREPPQPAKEAGGGAAETGADHTRATDSSPPPSRAAPRR